MMFVSTRRLFRRGDPGWEGYVARVGLPQLQEIRTVDGALNEQVKNGGSVYCEPSEIVDALATLPAPRGPAEYFLAAVKVDVEFWPHVFAGFESLGCDLSDETMTSSLLNCGPWTGPLRPFVERLGPYGLLSVDDACQAQALLPRAWGSARPHAFADVWALYGRPGGGT
ncbi:MAG TPA: hypothetical protein VHO06_10635 [Polyangia bacterium]|nr:hypothetical protein [Polyangia bacterium]